MQILNAKPEPIIGRTITYPVGQHVAAYSVNFLPFVFSPPLAIHLAQPFRINKKKMNT